MQWISTKERKPEKPGKASYEQIDCWVYLRNEVKHLVWNCEHLCWDDDTGDDWYCDAEEPSHWMLYQIPLPPPPPTEDKLEMVDHIGGGDKMIDHLADARKPMEGE